MTYADILGRLLRWGVRPPHPIRAFGAPEWERDSTLPGDPVLALQRLRMDKRWRRLRVLVCRKDPGMLHSVFAALFTGNHVILDNPDAPPQRAWETVERFAPDVLEHPPERELSMTQYYYYRAPQLEAEIEGAAGPELLQDAPEPYILIPTGGSTGDPKWAVHTLGTLVAAADSFLRFFGETEHQTVCTLPLYHVSGLMQVVRALVSGGRCHFAETRELIACGRFSFEPERCFISLVPTQLKRMMDSADGLRLLKRFKTILVGGAAADAELLASAREYKLLLAPCYGMTETAANLCALRPEAFLNGAEGVGVPFEAGAVRIMDEGGGATPVGVIGRVVVRPSSLCKSIFPDNGRLTDDGLVTDDLGTLDEEGHLRLHGRADRVINSGGEKIDPARVEAALLKLDVFSEAAVLGVDDSDWGECVAAVVVTREAFAPPSTRESKERLRSLLAPHEIPKRFLYRDALPRNHLGKLDLAALQAIANQPEPDQEALIEGRTSAEIAEIQAGKKPFAENPQWNELS